MDARGPRSEFTLAEASAQLPALRGHLATVLELRLRLKIIYQRLDGLGIPPGETLPWGAPAQAVTDHAVFASMSEALREEVDAIRALGVVVRDIEVGLIDWAARVPAGTPAVWWSWRLGERAIERYRRSDDDADRRDLAELPPAVLAVALGRVPEAAPVPALAAPAAPPRALTRDDTDEPGPT
ncbi:MAG: DUF2203 family protein [Kofleriaceae bacterium]